MYLQQLKDALRSAGETRYEDYKNEVSLVADLFINDKLFTEEVIRVVTETFGYNLDVLHAILYNDYGYTDTLEFIENEWL